MGEGLLKAQGMNEVDAGRDRGGGGGSAEATASGAAGPRSRQRALLGVGQVQGGSREGAVTEEQAG
jgi:hypothetical protein